MSKRNLVILLVVSLMGNLVLVGFILGQTFAQQGVDWSYGFPRMLQVLPPERRDELMQSIEPARKKLKPALAELRQHQLAIAQTISAETFDPEEYKRVVGLYTVKVQEARSFSDQMFLNMLKDMTVAERREIVEAARKYAEQRGRSKRQAENEPKKARTDQ